MATVLTSLVPRNEWKATVFTRDDEGDGKVIVDTLKKYKVIKVVNQYMTLYGVEFDRWLREKVLKDIDCKIRVVGYNKGYPWEYIITLL